MKLINVLQVTWCVWLGLKVHIHLIQANYFHYRVQGLQFFFVSVSPPVLELLYQSKRTVPKNVPTNLCMRVIYFIYRQEKQLYNNIRHKLVSIH